MCLLVLLLFLFEVMCITCFLSLVLYLLSFLHILLFFLSLFYNYSFILHHFFFAHSTFPSFFTISLIFTHSSFLPSLFYNSSSHFVQAKKTLRPFILIITDSFIFLTLTNIFKFYKDLTKQII